MTREQYDELIKEFGSDNIAIRQMELLHDHCGKKAKDLCYRGIRNAASLYVKSPDSR